MQQPIITIYPSSHSLALVASGSSVSLSGVGEEIMGAKQTTPCGAFADVKELEYISALHQTGKIGLRKDGSIHGA